MERSPHSLEEASPISARKDLKYNVQYRVLNAAGTEFAEARAHDFRGLPVGPSGRMEFSFPHSFARRNTLAKWVTKLGKTRSH